MAGLKLLTGRSEDIIELVERSLQPLPLAPGKPAGLDRSGAIESG